MKKGLAVLIIALLVVTALGLGSALAWVVFVKMPYEAEEVIEATEETITEESQSEEATPVWETSYIYWAQERPSVEQPIHPVQRMKGDGTEQKQAFVNNSTLDSSQSVVVSPDGETLAYACPSGVYELCIKKADGTGLVSPKLEGVPHQLSWSHDSKKIIMSVLVGIEDSSQYVIATVDKDGTNYQEVMKRDDLPGNSFYPSYFPEDAKILFQVEKEDGDRDIYTVNTNGSKIAAVINSDDKEYEPALSPDGKKIAYTVMTDDIEQIWTAKVDGQGPKQLTSKGTNKSPHFSPDGKKIAFIAKRDGGSTWEVYSMDADGSKQTRLTNNKINDLSPRWSQHEIGGLGVDFDSYSEVLDSYLVARMKGDSSTVGELVAEGSQDGSTEMVSSLAGTFSHYEIVREATISQSEKKVDVKLSYQDETKGSQERTYTLNLYQNEKWLVSGEEIKEEQSDTDSTDGEIKTGTVEHQMSDLEAMQKSADGGSQPWRLDPHMVALNDGGELGFNQATDTFTLISKIESGEYSGTGEATVEAKHNDTIYIIQLIQPVDQGDTGIWVINSVAEKG